MKRLQDMKSALAQWIAAEMSATKSWYKTGPSDILVSSEAEDNRVEFLSMHSAVIGSLKANGQILLYVRPEDAPAARLKKSSMPAAHPSAVQLTLALKEGESN
jgi:hypothetical protein